MLYREFGKTGIKVSVLGFGAMRLREIERSGEFFVVEDGAIEIMRRAFELGVNYVDTAYGYCHGKSEIAVGKALKGWRDKVYLSTKLPTWLVKTEGDYRRYLEEQLAKLDVNCIDFYHFHGLSSENYENVILKNNLLRQAELAKEEGLIKHISFSFHDKPEVLKMLVDTGIFETVLCQYNLLDRSNEEAMAYARSKGLGVVVMGPAGGGRLGMPSEVLQRLAPGRVKSTPEIALRFVLANKNVSCTLSGMNTMEMVEENTRIASVSGGLDPEEIDRLNAAMDENRKLAELYCTGCNYCMPCPNDVDIPSNFKLMNYYRVYGLCDYAKEVYQKIDESKRAGSCIECGECEGKCPQRIEIRKQLKETALALG